MKPGAQAPGETIDHLSRRQRRTSQASPQAHPQWFQEDLLALLQLLEDDEIQPRISERIGVEQIAEAHERIERGGLDGKIMYVPS